LIEFDLPTQQTPLRRGFSLPMQAESVVATYAPALHCIRRQADHLSG
jgi:hypothetical protein